MANPRKFSEKIALHNQKQAEGNAAFDAIMREVTETTRIGPPLTYQPGSLPNVSSKLSIDLQGALLSLEVMKQQAMGHHHHPPDYYASHARQMHHVSKGADCHPSYNSSFLTLPQDSSWRRSNSDSALHASTVGSQNAVNGSSTSNGSCSAVSPPHCAPVENGFGWHNVEVKREYDYRPKSCEVSEQNNCTMYPPPSPVPLPVPNNTGSLPDLSSLQFPPPLVTPLDGEEQACYGMYASSRQARGGCYATSSLNAPSSHIGAMRSASPVHRRRHGHAVPSPLVLHGSHGDVTPSPIMSPYRRSPSDSPTSPLSQRSYSPALSPMMPASPFMPPAIPDPYYLQQQLSQTSSLQQQFEQFNMGGHQDGGGVYGGQHLMPAGSPGCSTDYYQKNYFSRSPLHASSPPQQVSPMSGHMPPFPPLSPYHHRKAADVVFNSEPYQMLSSQNGSFNSKLHIPDIVLTGVDDSLGRHDFARELGHAMAGVPESFHHEFNCFGANAARIGLDPLDTDSLQMLSDPYGMVADPATEDSFRLEDSRQHAPCCTAPL